MLFYRYFLKQFSLISPTDQERYASTIIEKLGGMGSSLKNFTSLNKKTERFLGKDKKKRHRTDSATLQGSGVACDEIIVINLPSEIPPPLKKVNTM